MRSKLASSWIVSTALFLLVVACGGGSDGGGAAPSAPVEPVISGVSATSTAGHKATLAWTTDRPCSAVVSYQKAGAAAMTRKLVDQASTRSLVLDLLEAGTPYDITLDVTDIGGHSSQKAVQVTTASAIGTPTITATVDAATTKSISPYIYGLNFNGLPSTPGLLTLNRMGGNRWTAYNWENNASNAGSDWYYSSDGFLGGGSTPAEAVRSSIAADQAAGRASIMTIQMQGYVSADMGGNVDPAAFPSYLATRFRQAIPKKSTQSAAAFTATPDISDAYVYMDEFLWALDHKLPGLFTSGAALPTFVSLDNEPELWNFTHREVQGSTGPTADAYIQQTITLASALKDTFPDVQILGPAHYGFGGFYNWQGASGFDASTWFADKYLEDLKAASTTYGRRLVDVYDLHFYSEARGEGSRVTGLAGPNLTPSQVQAIVQSPRSLWDTTYKEDSWIANDVLGGPIYILQRMQDKIAAHWPGTKLAITEYYNGGDHHVAGAIAQADNLGVYGAMDVWAATLWPGSDCPYPLAGFQAFRNYDGAGACFGDTSLKTTSSHPSNVAVYVSRNSALPGRTVIVAINRSTASQDLAFSGLAASGTAKVYRIDASGPRTFLAGTLPVDMGTTIITLPPLTVSTLEIQ